MQELQLEEKSQNESGKYYSGTKKRKETQPCLKCGSFIINAIQICSKCREDNCKVPWCGKVVSKFTKIGHSFCREHKTKTFAKYILNNKWVGPKTKEEYDQVKRSYRWDF